MSIRISIKILWVGLLMVGATFAAYTMDAVGNRETINATPYIYGQTPPICLGEIKSPDNAYVHLEIHFQADSTEGYPNVFQTAPVNRGMRMEISGSTAAIIVPDSSVPGGLMGLTLTTALKTGQWYALEVEAINGAYVRAKLDGQNVIDYASAGLSMETSQLLVGGGLGFNPPRVFHGRIDNIFITKGSYSKLWVELFSSVLLTQWVLVTLLLLGALFVFLMPLLKNTEHRVILLEKSEKISLISFIVLVGFISSLFYHYINSAYLGLSYPYNTFLFRPADAFRDFLVTINQVSNLDPYKNNETGLVANYFPLSYVLLYPLTFINYYIAVFLFAIFSILTVLLMNCNFFYIKNKESNVNVSSLINILILTFFSYPILFCLDRLNIEFLVLFFAVLFIHFSAKKKYLNSYICLSLAALIKPYVILYLLIDAQDEFFRKIKIFFPVFLFISALSFSLLQNSLSEDIRLLMLGLARSGQMFSAEKSVFFSVSLLEPIKYFLSFLEMDKNDTLFYVKAIYYILVMSLFIFLVHLMIRKNIAKWLKVLLITIFILIGTHVSYDYKLILIYLPLYLFVNSNIPCGKIFTYVTIFVISFILIPKDYFYIYKDTEVSISVILNPSILFIYFIYAYYYHAKVK